MKSVIKATAARIAELSPPGPKEPPIHPIIECLRASGLLSACVPEEFGGQGLAHHPADLHLLIEALVAIGSANLSAGRLFEGHVNATKLVTVFAEGEQRERWLKQIFADALFGVWGADGPDAVRLRGNRLSGQKLYASGADVLQSAIITAHDEQQRTVLIILPADRLVGRLYPTEWSMSGMQATASGRCDLRGLAITKDDLLGHPGDYHREPHFSGGVWRYAAVQSGAMRTIARDTAAQLTARGHHKAPQQLARLRRIVTACETSRLWLERAAAAVETPDAGPFAHSASVLSRLVVADEATALLAATDAALGAASFSTSNPIERRRRDLLVYLRQANPDGLENSIMQLIVSEMEARQQWHLA